MCSLVVCVCVCHKSLRFWGIVAALPSAACQKLQLQLPLRFLLPRPLRIPFAGSSSIWSKAEQLSVKMRNTYAQSAPTHTKAHTQACIDMNNTTQLADGSRFPFPLRSHHRSPLPPFPLPQMPRMFHGHVTF